MPSSRTLDDTNNNECTPNPYPTVTQLITASGRKHPVSPPRAYSLTRALRATLGGTGRTTWHAIDRSKHFLKGEGTAYQTSNIAPGRMVRQPISTGSKLNLEVGK